MKTGKPRKMDKRGQAELVGAVILGSLLLASLFGSYVAISEHRYVVDIETKKIYDLTKCTISNLENVNLQYIESGEINAYHKQGYEDAICKR